MKALGEMWVFDRDNFFKGTHCFKVYFNNKSAMGL